MRIPAGQFKAKCLKIMDDIQDNREDVIITKHGKPVAKLIPIHSKVEKRPLFGYLKGSVLIHGDIIEPVGEAWDADA